MKKVDLRIERERLRREANKMFILKAAERVFARKGYGLATVDDIAEEAQFSKATLYRYFASKKDIFLEIILSSFEEADKRTAQILLRKARAEEKLKELIYSFSSYYHKKKNIFRILFVERDAVRKILGLDSKEQLLPSPHHPRIPQVFRGKMERIFNVICEVIREGIESGEFQKVNVKDAAFILGAMLRGFHFKGPTRDRGYSIEESANLILSFFLYGIKKERKA